jgi:transposase
MSGLVSKDSKHAERTFEGVPPCATAARRQFRPPAPAHARLDGRRRTDSSEEANELEAELRTLVRATAPVLLAQPGVGPVTAAQVLISSGRTRAGQAEAAEGVQVSGLGAVIGWGGCGPSKIARWD